MIHLNDKISYTIFSLPGSLNNLSHNVLGNFEHRMQAIVERNLLAATPPSEFCRLLEETGIQPVVQRADSHWDLAKKIHDPINSIEVEEIRTNPGVFKIINRATHQIIAIFKPGSFRACTENAVFGLSVLLGLDDHFVNGRFAVLATNGFQEQSDDALQKQDEALHKKALQNNMTPFFGFTNDDNSDSESGLEEASVPSTPRQRYGEENNIGIAVKTWHPGYASYLEPPHAMVGILEPFVEPAASAEPDLMGFVRMILLLLVAGVREMSKQMGNSKTLHLMLTQLFREELSHSFLKNWMMMKWMTISVSNPAKRICPFFRIWPH